MRTDRIIDVRDVRVMLDHTEILHGVEMQVPRGSFVGLLGPNGSGKTTLLRTIAGLVPFSGGVSIDGVPVGEWKRRLLARRLAFVRQNVTLAFDFTVRELVLLGRSPHKRWLEDYSSEDHRLSWQALSEVDLEGFGERSILSLSGGELQRVFLAQALVQQADVLLLDEPTAHLDVHYQFEFMDLVRELVDGGRTAIAVFHDLNLAARYADLVVVLRDGRVAGAGPPGAVLTEALIRSVFRMTATVGVEADGRPRIRFVGPTASSKQAEPSQEQLDEDLYAHR